MIRSVTPEAQTQTFRDASEARRFASEMIRARQHDGSFDACALLNEYPELAGYGSAVLDLVYEEYSRRADAGEALDSDAFADRFPEFRSAVLEHIHAHRVLERCFGADPAWPDAGDVVLGCELLEEIGRGAFSRVFRARQTALGGRNVVVKLCPCGAHEAQLLGKLEHEHIVPVHAVESDAGRRLTAIVMPFLGRATLRDVVDRCCAQGAVPGTARSAADAVRLRNGEGESTPADAVRGSYVHAIVSVMHDVARGMAHAHRKGVLHADIKPSNVLVTAALRAKLLDFNLSHDPGALTNMTGGTVPYMAPEQLLVLAQRGEPAPTAAADIYAFGATLFEALVGSSPYGAVPAGMDRTTLADWLLRRRQEGWDTLERAAPHVPRTIRQLAVRCLSFDPRERPSDFDAIAVLLARELRPGMRLLRRAQRHWRITALAGIVALLGIVGAVVSYAVADPAYRVDFDAGHRSLVAGNYQAAVESFDAAERQMPADASAEFQSALWFERGRARVRRQSPNDLDGAFRDFNRVIALDPQHAAAHAALGYAYVADFDSSAAVRDFDGLFAKALAQFQLARAHGLDTPELRFDVACCQYHIPTLRGTGVAELQQLIRGPEKDAVPRDVRAAALLLLARAALTGSNEVEMQAPDVERLIALVEHCGPVHLMAAHLYLHRAGTQSNGGDAAAVAESLSAALRCSRLAIQHGVARSEIDRLRSLFPLIADDRRFVDVSPAGPPIESAPLPPIVLDPLGGAPLRGL